MTHLYYCCQCNIYTLQKKCPTCHHDVIEQKPARYSPQDHYGKYRRALKKQQKEDQ